MLKPEVTVNPTGDEGHWGLEKARRMTSRLVSGCDRATEKARAIAAAKAEKKARET